MIDIELLKQLREQGVPNNEIAKRLGCHPSTVTDYVRKLNLPKRTPKFNPTEVEALILAGYTAQEIADRFGVLRTTVSKWRKKLGLPPMKSGKAILFKPMYLSGASYEEIAEVLGISVNYAKVLRHTLKLPPRRPRGLEKPRPVPLTPPYWCRVLESRKRPRPL
ncbi:MAG: helix-turn-helix domain-containing protein [Candidatus Bathyarchaeia archaeon]